jgi:hypothetical protein
MKRTLLRNVTISSHMTLPLISCRKWPPPRITTSGYLRAPGMSWRRSLLAPFVIGSSLEKAMSVGFSNVLRKALASRMSAATSDLGLKGTSRGLRAERGRAG